MTPEQTLQNKVSEYISGFLDTHFGEPPPTVNVIIQQPFIVIHLLGFLMPGEKMLLKRKEAKRVVETRDVLMNGLKSELTAGLTQIVGFKLAEFYMDWNLEKETGLFIAVSDEAGDKGSLHGPEDIDVTALKKKIIDISSETQKKPDHTAVYWLNDVTLLIERIGIMVEIEKELIKNGVLEELRMAKRPLEHRLLESLKLEPVLKQEVSELFVDWNFEDDKAYLVLILEPSTE